ncbi:MAG: PTPA-CTERM sorting domain-containing protein [Stenomitos frigidus ULC029]
MTISTITQKLPVAIVGAAFIAFGTISALPSHATTLTGFQTFGNQMAGMKVTADFLAGGSETLTWAATGPGAGGVSGSGWSLLQSGDTFSSPWTFAADSGKAIRSLLINAIPGNTVFDNGSNPSTPGSFNGTSFTVQTGTAPTSFGYSVPIDISLGDLFGSLSLNYATGFTGSMTFLADTDSGTTNDPVKPSNNIPTPALLPGLIGLGFGVLRKRKAEAAKQTSEV